MIFLHSVQGFKMLDKKRLDGFVGYEYCRSKFLF